MFREYTAYFDSAGGDDYKFIVVAGWLSTLERWELFKVKWNRLLLEYEVPYFHMKDISQWKGPFKKWYKDENKRARFIAEAYNIIRQHREKGIACIVNYSAYTEVARDHRIQAEFGNPYSFAGFICASIFKTYVRKKYPKFSPRITYIFDDEKVGKGLLMKSMKRRGLSNPIFQPWRDQLNKVGKVERYGVIQLQSADFPAYEIRKLYSEDPVELKKTTTLRRSMRLIGRLLPIVIFEKNELVDLCKKNNL